MISLPPNSQPVGLVLRYVYKRVIVAKRRIMANLFYFLLLVTTRTMKLRRSMAVTLTIMSDMNAQQMEF